MSGILNFQKRKGETLDVTLQFDQGIDPPYSISGWTFAASVKEQAGEFNEVVESFVISIVDAAERTIRMILDTSEMPSGVYFYDMYHVIDGKKTYILEGAVTLTEPITE